MISESDQVCLSFPFLHRFIEAQGEELSVEALSKDLKTLAKSTKATKYRDVMKLLRLALSGLQVYALLQFLLCLFEEIFVAVVNHNNAIINEGCKLYSYMSDNVTVLYFEYT